MTMKTQDFPESENIEDRRDDEPPREPLGIETAVYRTEDTLRSVRDYPDDEEHQGDLSDQGGFNDIKGGEQGTVGKVLKGALKHARLAAGGPVDTRSRIKPVNTLKRIAEHPIFPNVKVVHARIPGLTSSSSDMKTVTINDRVPTTIVVNGKRVPTAAPLAVFELYSRAGCEVYKEAAQKAGHQADEQDVQTCARRDVGEVAEKHFLKEHYGFTAADWQAYCKIMDQGARRKLDPGTPSFWGGGPVEDSLSRAEKNLVDYHRNTMVTGQTGRDEEGRPVTIYSNTIQTPEGKYATVPGWYDGKMHTDEDELNDKWGNDIKEGYWPTYDSAEEGDQRAKHLHQVMEDDFREQE